MPTFDSLTGKLAPQSILIRRYLITRLAGRGGMSAIYQALDMNQNRRKVAIKEMSQENLDDEERSEALTRFQQEASLLERLNHPNLPRIYDYFNSGGRSFLVMDYIDGKTLLQLLHDAGKPLVVDQVIHYADQLCDVLSYLHQQNPPIIFRDLKPTNVMATQDGRVFLVDFGIARFFKEGQNQDTTVLGSPGYAPPEQHGSAQTSPRSDLYALGATLHCCLTNRDPYNATDRFNFAPVRQFNPQVPAELDQLIMRLLELDENKRPANALEVKKTLTRIRQQMRPQNNNMTMPAATATPIPPTRYANAVAQPAPPPTIVAPPASLPTVVAPLASPPIVAPPRPPAPVYQPAQRAVDQSVPQGQMVLRTTPIPPPTPNMPAYPGYPASNRPLPSPVQTGPDKSAPPPTQVWTLGFCLTFLILLIITVMGCVLALAINQPYPDSPTANLNHALEAGLALSAMITAIIIIAMTRSAIAIVVVLTDIAVAIVIGFAFLLQTLRDVQPNAEIFAQLDPHAINQLITYGLLVSGIVSLIWLLRPPFTWSDRLWILLFAFVICICSLWQFQYLDTNLQDITTKHILLCTTLITFILSILLTGQMERKRKRS